MEESETPSKNIRKILSDITLSIQQKKDDLRKSINALRRDHHKQVEDTSKEDTSLYALFEDINRESQALTNRKALIKRSLDKEEVDLQKLEKENKEFLTQMNDLERLNKILKERKIETEDKQRILQSKASSMKERLEAKSKDQKSLNEAYKKFLGIEIQQVRNDVLKIQFSDLNDDFYCIIDFSQEDWVTECFPLMNIDRLNYVLKEKGGFKDFIKYLREQFKQKM